MARLAEELGFDAFFRSDHYIDFFGSGGLPGPTDSWMTIAGLARDTTTIRLGTLVSPITFRNPGPLAITVAQADAMSGGRVELGLGAGWNDREHEAYGIPFPDTGGRFERLEEQLAIVTGLWTTPVGESFSFEGQHYTLVDSPALPKPVQQPHPPIVIGGFGPKRTPRLAATYASEFNVGFAPVSMFPSMVERVRATCERRGRAVDTLGISIANTTVCGSDDAEVAAACAGHPSRSRPLGRHHRGDAVRGDRHRRRLSRRRRRHRVLPAARPARPRPSAPARRSGCPRVPVIVRHKRRRVSGASRGARQGASDRGAGTLRRSGDRINWFR